MSDKDFKVDYVRVKNNFLYHKQIEYRDSSVFMRMKKRAVYVIR